jgi:hypothetical protein
MSHVIHICELMTKHTYKQEAFLKRYSDNVKLLFLAWCLSVRTCFFFRDRRRYWQSRHFRMSYISLMNSYELMKSFKEV